NNDIVGEAIDINVIAFVFEELLNTENASVGLPNHVLPILLTDAIVAYRGSHVTNVESHDSHTIAAGACRAHGSMTNPQSLNRYAYVVNSPTGAIDPLGLCTYATGFGFVDC